MKSYLSLLVFTISFSIFSQEAITKTVGEFSTLKVYDLINISLIKSDENRVEISGKNKDDVVIVNKNGTLKIKMNLEEYFDGNKTTIDLYYTAVDVIDVNEGAYVTSTEEISQYEIELKAQEGGFIKLNLNVKETKIKSVSGGVIELKGKTNNQNLTLSTGGIFKGKDYESVTSKVAIRAGGEAYVNTSELIDIKIRAGGDVYIYGDPNTINESRALGGRIKRM